MYVTGGDRGVDVNLHRGRVGLRTPTSASSDGRLRGRFSCLRRT
jgi:hypothetical protein